MKGDNYTNKLPFKKCIAAFESETFEWNSFLGIALNGAAPCIEHRLYRVRVRHNIRKQLQLPFCAITDIRCKSLNSANYKSPHT